MSRSDKGKNQRTAIVIPALNEAKVIQGVIRSLQHELKKQALDFQIVVIDDGSRDDTATKAKRAGAHVISHIMNTGTGGATATGLSYAQQNNFTMAATFDADGQHDASDLIKGIKLMAKGNADLLIGSRLIDAKGMSRVKVLGNWGLSTITHLLFGVSVTDSQSGLRVFSRNALDNLRWKTSGYEFCSEMLWRAKQQNLTIKEFPIKAIYTEYSTSRTRGQNNWNGVNILKSLLQRRITEMFGE